jgi:hypothetical protein
MDKLTAMSTLQTAGSRTIVNPYSRYGVPSPVTASNGWMTFTLGQQVIYERIDDTHLAIMECDPDNPDTLLPWGHTGNASQPFFEPGEIIDMDGTMTTNVYDANGVPVSNQNGCEFIVTESVIVPDTYGYLVPGGDPGGYGLINIITILQTLPADAGLPDFTAALVCYSAAYYGQNIYITTAGVITYIDAILLIQAFYNQVWGTTEINNLTGDNSYPISLQYFSQLVDVNPFGTDPLTALTTLANQ